jgi:hypothetical protein
MHQLDARSGWTESPLRYRTENSTKSLCQLQDSERNAVAKLERLDEDLLTPCTKAAATGVKMSPKAR